MIPFAQAFTAQSLVQWVIIAVVIVGVIGIALVVARQAGVTIPSFVITILWIVFACVIGIIAIRFIASSL